MTRVVLHIGTHKTGTTALQEFIAYNADAFARQGLACYQLAKRYPGVQKTRSGYFLYKYAKTMLDGQRSPGASPDPRAAGNLDSTTLENIVGFQAAVSNSETVLLSDERLWYQGAVQPQTWKLLKDLLYDLGASDVQIVVYFRRQDQFIASLWSQWVKGRTRLRSTLPSFAAESSSVAAMDYWGGLQQIEAAFGEGSVTVRVFDRAKLVDSDIRRDFCSLLGIEVTPEFTFCDDRSNLGLTASAAEVKRQANHVAEYREQDNFLRQPALSVSSLMRETGAPPHLPADAAQAVLERYGQGNAEIARKYLHREDGILFRPYAPGGAQQGDASQDELLRETIRFFTAALSQEHAARLALERRVKQLERKTAPAALFSRLRRKL